jgi:pimeloyl-ACP methyl ester carboxylesterase
VSAVEIPYWVPHGDTAIAVCLTVPPDATRLVALLQVGGGVPRTHRNRAWVYAARQLAERGVATLRMDYPGTGDSTGEASLSLERPPADAVIEVIDHARRVTGIDRIGVAGQCLGVRTAIEAASAISACDSLVLVMPVTLRPALRGSDGPRLAVVRKATAGRLRRLKRRARQRWDHLDVRRGASLDPAIETVTSRADLLLLHGGTSASRAWLDARAAELSAASPRHRVQMQALPTIGASGFRALDVQVATRAALTEWFAGHERI